MNREATLAKYALSWMYYTGADPQLAASQAGEPIGSVSREHIWLCKTGTPEWIVDMIHEAHEDIFPDDFCYEAVADVLEKIADEDDLDMDADIYHADLVAWLASHSVRAGYVDDVVEEMGWPKEGIYAALQMGQAREKDDIACRVYNFLEELDDAEVNWEPMVQENLKKLFGDKADEMYLKAMGIFQDGAELKEVALADTKEEIDELLEDK